MVQSGINHSRVIPIESQSDVVVARQSGRALARIMGFGTAQQTRLATAISELVRNALIYAGGGSCYIDDASDAMNIRIRVRIEDSGPGIADIDLALTGGYSSAGSLGAGLPGSRRLVQNFLIESGPQGTNISIEISRIRG
ncbi:MAG: anti-sigma regulatory factor [Chloroflexi bacterium]|nr:anti-sigma regulatory factor [Chloroflexota bacterium]